MLRRDESWSLSPSPLSLYPIAICPRWVTLMLRFLRFIHFRKTPQGLSSLVSRSRGIQICESNFNITLRITISNIHLKFKLFSSLFLMPVGRLYLGISGTFLPCATFEKTQTFLAIFYTLFSDPLFAYTNKFSWLKRKMFCHPIFTRQLLFVG